MTTKDFTLSDFNKVEISGAFEFEIIRGDGYKVQVTGGNFPHLRVEVKGDTLIIRRQGIDWFAPFHGRPNAGITMPLLKGLEISGATIGKISGFQADNDLTIKLTGASRLEMAECQAADVEVDISGASTVTGDIVAKGTSGFEASGASTIELKGEGADLKLELSGASKAELKRYAVRNADVKISGASNGTVNLNGKLNADISGASNLSWTGTPVMGDIRTSGASSLNRK